MSLDKDFVELSRIRPCLSVRDWPVRRQGDMKHKRKILRRKFLRWEKWALKWFYAICQILLRGGKKKNHTTNNFSQRTVCWKRI